MLHKAARMMRYLGAVGLLTLCAAVAAPAVAAEDSELVYRPVATGSQSAAAERIEDIHQNAAAFEASHPGALDHPAVRVGGVAIMRFRTAAGGYTALQRREMVQARYVTASSGLDYTSRISVTTGTSGGEAMIYLAGHKLVTVTSADAAANGGGNASDLADVWAANLRHALAVTTN